MHKSASIVLAFLVLTSGISACTKKVDEVKAKVICSDGEYKFDSEGLTGIVGGSLLHKDTSLARNIVYLQTINEEGNPYQCTASLIGYDLILTAAHCVDMVKNSSEVKVAFTHQPECDSANGELSSEIVPVKEIQIHPSWKKTGDKEVRGDLALIRLKRLAPSPWQPVKLAAKFIAPDSGKILVAGFGVDTEQGLRDGSISLRIAEVSPILEKEKTVLNQAYDSKAFSDDKLNPEMNNGEKDEMIYISQSSGVGVCFGDSGGPSVMKDESGKFVQTGVASVVLGLLKSSPCGFAGGHSSVYYHRKWITDTAKAMGSGL